MAEVEKGDPMPSTVLQHKDSSSDGEVGRVDVQESWATRNGFNLRSFQKKEDGANITLERPMKTRHLHMISIGTSPFLPVRAT
jgi:yeast amino acid transporter